MLGEIDNLAARQGEDEAQKQQNLIDEIETLQSKFAQTTKMESFTGYHFYPTVIYQYY